MPCCPRLLRLRSSVVSLFSFREFSAQNPPTLGCGVDSCFACLWVGRGGDMLNANEPVWSSRPRHRSQAC